MKIIVHTDGGARGNPGRAAVGVVIERTQNTELNDQLKTKKIVEFGKRIGETTNNVAEYTAVIEAFREVKKIVGEKKEMHFFLDSTLVVNQLNGLFKVREPHLRDLLTKIRILEQEVGGDASYTSVPREKNQRADFLVNQALDGR